MQREDSVTDIQQLLKSFKRMRTTFDPLVFIYWITCALRLGTVLPSILFFNFFCFSRKTCSFLSFFLTLYSSYQLMSFTLPDLYIIVPSSKKITFFCQLTVWFFTWNKKYSYRLLLLLQNTYVSILLQSNPSSNWKIEGCYALAHA